MVEKHLPSWLHKHDGEHRWPAALAVTFCLFLQISQGDETFPSYVKGLILGIECLLLLLLLIFNPKKINKINL